MRAMAAIEMEHLRRAYGDVVAVDDVSLTVSRVHPEVEVTLLRAAQEALANVARHAGPSRVGLTLSYMEDLVTHDVRDDGVGFTSVNGGFRLTGMRQRVQGVGGVLEVESAPGDGTAISASVPA